MQGARNIGPSRKGRKETGVAGEAETGTARRVSQREDTQRRYGKARETQLEIDVGTLGKERQRKESERETEAVM